MSISGNNSTLVPAEPTEITEPVMNKKKSWFENLNPFGETKQKV